MSELKTTKTNRKEDDTMENLIEVREEQGELLVSGRDLHKALEIGTQFTKWFDRMVAYGFSENIDFLTISQKRLTAQGNETTYTDYILKLDMAKELCMIQRSPIGKKFRQYFIEVEKRYRNQVPQISEKDKLALQILNSTGETERLKALCLYTDAVERPLLETIEEQGEVIEVLEPKAKYTDTILQNSSLVNISQIAKDYGMSGQALNKKLNELKVQYKQGGQWLLYSKYQDKGYTHSKTSNLYDTVGIDKVVMSTKWTQKGRLFLYELLKKNGILPVVERLSIYHELEGFSRPYSREEPNFFINYDVDADALIAVEETPNYINPFKLYFESEEDIERAIQAIGEERLKEYLKK